VDAGAGRGGGAVVGVAWGTAEVMGDVQGVAKVDEAADEGATRRRVV
jgi:hypothetical protein